LNSREFHSFEIAAFQATMPKTTKKDKQRRAAQYTNPVAVLPRKAQMPQSDNEQRMKNFYFFWKSASPFSQWHPCDYQHNGVIYKCAEQGMMHGKALLFGDDEIAKKILATQDPRQIKALGRQVRFFIPEVWRQHCEQIVYENSIAKFTQNPCLLEVLLSTKGSLLVEASPYDAIWGIGLSEKQALRVPSDKWPGSNLLGRILTRVRDEIQSGLHIDAIAEHNGQQKELEKQPE
jgi:hypothetical protein